MSLYRKLFGADFQDPNAAQFSPDPRVMVRKSALSGVLDSIHKLSGQVGSEDRERLEQYFSGIRDLELQFDRQLTKPEPIAACHVPPPVGVEPKLGMDTALVAERHRS